MCWIARPDPKADPATPPMRTVSTSGLRATSYRPPNERIRMQVAAKDRHRLKHLLDVKAILPKGIHRRSKPADDEHYSPYTCDGRKLDEREKIELGDAEIKNPVARLQGIIKLNFARILLGSTWLISFILLLCITSRSAASCPRARNERRGGGVTSTYWLGISVPSTAVKIGHSCSQRMP
jgi:hypothetical protein